jgi:ribulose kinase
MLAIMGTSTCHVMSSSALVHVPGCCGVVDGGIVSGLYGYEAGQSGVGDIFAWYVENQVPPRCFAAAAAAGISIHQHLSDLAAAERVGAHGLVALDWHSGNRSILVDHQLSGQCFPAASRLEKAGIFGYDCVDGRGCCGYDAVHSAGASVPRADGGHCVVSDLRS